MNRSMKSIAAALLFVFALSFAAPVRATTFAECQAALTQLKTDTQNVALAGPKAETKDRPGMIAIVDAASLLVSQAKFGDAVTKLENFKTKVNDQLKAKNINTDPAQGVTAQDLLNEADSAIACIKGLSSQSAPAY